jgi:hypothetical protein
MLARFVKPRALRLSGSIFDCTAFNEYNLQMILPSPLEQGTQVCLQLDRFR